MSDTKPPFYFTKTEFLAKIKRLEDLLGVGSFDADLFTTKINEIETLVNTINDTYTTRLYVDNNLIQKINRTGGTLTGNLTLTKEPTDPDHLVTKSFVENLISQIGTLDSTVFATKQYVTNTITQATLIDTSNLATKEYVDAAIAALTDVNTSLIATKTYVDVLSETINLELDNKISKFGDVLYGELILSDDGREPLHPITKQQFDVSLSTVAQVGNLDW